MKYIIIIMLAVLAGLIAPATASAIITPGPPNQEDHPRYNSSTYLHIGDAEAATAFEKSIFNEGGEAVIKTAIEDCAWRISDAAHGCAAPGTTWSVHNSDGTVTAYIYGVSPAYHTYCRYSARWAGTDYDHWYYKGVVTKVDYCGFFY